MLIGIPSHVGIEECNYRDSIITDEMREKAKEYDAFTSLDYYTATSDICSIHDNVFVYLNENIPFNPQFGEREKAGISLIHDRARHFIAVTESVRTALLMYGVDSNRISVINFWGCDTNYWKPLDYTSSDTEKVLNDLGLPLDIMNDMILLFVGRLERPKGLHVLIEALGKVPNLHLIVVGKDGIPQYESQARYHACHDRVHFVGYVELNDLLRLYNIADLLILPSLPTATWVEQLGRVLIEAMSCCTPCISTNVGGPIDVIDHNVTGLLVRPDDADDIARSIMQLHGDHDLLAAMGMASRLKCLRKFSKGVVDREILKCIEEHIEYE